MVRRELRGPRRGGVPALPRGLALLALFGSASLTIAISHKLIASPQQIEQSIERGVPGFGCSDIRIEQPGGLWGQDAHVLRAALRKPQQCVMDIKRRVQRNKLFQAQHCNVVQQCWVRREENTMLTFTFYPGYTTFRFESN